MSERFQIYSLARKWGKQDYRQLIKTAGEFCDSFMLVDRIGVADEGQEVLRNLRTFLVDEHRGQKWPGTCLIGVQEADIYKFRLVDASAAVLIEASRSLWDWLGPRYPEDLSFIRASGAPWFVSTAHERDAFFKLLPGEKEAVEAVLGKDCLVHEHEDHCPQEAY